MQKAEDHHCEEPQEPQEKDNNRVFSNVQINEQNNEQSNMQEDAFNENYESVKKRESHLRLF